MKKPYTFLAFIFMASLSLIPPIDFFISNPPSEYWLWMILIAGFLGILTLFIKTDGFIPIIAIGGFVNCFFSAVPYVSFTSYVSLVACCYFFIVCQRIEDWDFIFKAVQSVMLLNILIIFMKLINHDNLMNFASGTIRDNKIYLSDHFGTVGQHMVMGSFSIVLAAFLISSNILNLIFPIFISIICKSSWTYLSVCCGIFVYLYFSRKEYKYFLNFIFPATVFLFLLWAIKDHKIAEAFSPISGRAMIWTRSIVLSLQHPFSGWGLGSYKVLFPAISQLSNTVTPWKTAHNFIVQLIFEVGFLNTAAILSGVLLLAKTLKKKKLYVCLSGLTMIFIDALVHFPERSVQMVLIIILFLAFCQKEIYGHDLIKNKPC